MDFENNIKKWVQIDNNVKLLNDNLKTLRDQRNQLNHEIVDYASKHNMSDSIIKISDGKLKFVNTSKIEPLTFKYIETTLAEIISDKSQIKFIIDTLKQKRENKTIFEIKRYS